jgi:hypothetical protein
MDKLPGLLQVAKEAIEMDIRLWLDPSSVPAVLATTCLSKSVTFVEGFIKVLTSTFEQLKFAKFLEKKAWALMMELGKRVCQEIHKEQGVLLWSIKVRKDKTDCDDLAHLMIRAILCAHKVMAEYSRLEFKDHPIIMSEYIKFLATNLGFEVVTALKMKLEVTTKELAALKKQFDSLKSMLDKTSTKMDEMKKLVDKVVKKYPL